MYTATRCPGCHVTIYTVKSDGGGNVLEFKDMGDVDLPFYSCPVPNCSYKADGSNGINLYTRVHLDPETETQINLGFTVAPRTPHTKPLSARAYKTWTAKDESDLVELWNKDQNLDVIAEALDRSKEAVRMKLRSMGKK